MIYLVTHNDSYSHKEYGDDYIKLFVGDMYNYPESLDSINHLNPYINELTGLYHLWKNCDDEIIGLNHYRRVFINPSTSAPYTVKESEEILKDYDVICDAPFDYSISLIRVLRREYYTDKEIFDKYYNLLCDTDPDIRDYFETNTFFNICNMMIGRKDIIIDPYSEWLFPKIIPLAEQFVKEDAVRCSNKRLLGFFFERIFTCWLLKNNIKRFETPHIIL